MLLVWQSLALITNQDVTNNDQGRTARLMALPMVVAGQGPHRPADEVGLAPVVTPIKGLSSGPAAPQVQLQRDQLSKQTDKAPDHSVQSITAGHTCRPTSSPT